MTEGLRSWDRVPLPVTGPHRSHGAGCLSRPCGIQGSQCSWYWNRPVNSLNSAKVHQTERAIEIDEPGIPTTSQNNDARKFPLSLYLHKESPIPGGSWIILANSTSILSPPCRSRYCPARSYKTVSKEYKSKPVALWRKSAGTHNDTLESLVLMIVERHFSTNR